MRFLLDLQLKYKFWLVNSVSLVSLLIVVLFSMSSLQGYELNKIQLQTQGQLQLKAANSNHIGGGNAFIYQPNQPVQWSGNLAPDDYLIQQIEAITQQAPAGFYWHDAYESRWWRGVIGRWFGNGWFSDGKSRYIALQALDQGRWIGQQVQVPSVLGILWREALPFALMTCLAMVPIFLASQLLINYVTRPITQLQRVMEKVNKDGDLSVRAKAESSDEVGRMALAFNQMAENLAGLVEEITRAAGTLTGLASKMVAEEAENVASIEVQREEIDRIARAMEAMAANSKRVQLVAAKNNESAQSSLEVACNGNSQVTSTVAEISNLAQEIRNTATAVNHLAEESGSIGGALDAINAIAEQTNLLALNAAIEAARAGEQGRGFAVVAGEVRGLAKNVALSTDDILVQLQRLLKASESAVEIMNARSDQAGLCMEQANQAGSLISELAARSQAIQKANGHIVRDISDQANTVLDLSTNINKLRREMDSVAESIRKNSEGSKALSNLVIQMNKSIHHLKIH